MNILVGWDNPAELDLLQMYLQVDDNQVVVSTSPAELQAHAQQQAFDGMIFPIAFPDPSASFALFEQLSKLCPGVPILLAVHPGEVYPLARFIRHGLRWYVYRDPAGDFLFLMQTLLESCIEAQRAEEFKVLANRLREEVDAVRRLQESILPSKLNCPRGLSAVARYEPSQINMSNGSPVVLAGGDYYHLFSIDESRMVLLVGDASGHGIKACMSIMTMHTLINQLQRDFDRPPHEFVAEINRRLCTHDLVRGDGGFITLIYGVMVDDTLHYASAGHCLPVLQNLSTNEVWEAGNIRTDGGAPLAIFEEADYETKSIKIPTNHRLCIYTDGLVEAFAEGDVHRQFGLEGLMQTLRDTRLDTLDNTLNELFKRSYEFTLGHGRHDDTSVLLLERHH